MHKPFSAHTQFFSSLKHLEKRLNLENNQAAGPSTLPQPPPPPPIEPHEVINSTQETDSLGTPIYLCNQSSTNASHIQESEAPQEFLPKSLNSPPTNHDEAEAEERVDQPERLDLDNDIELLMQLLRLSDAGTNEVGCDDEFYDRIVGMKGPKNVKELERLEQWIKHFCNGESKEPFRLAHLLLGKAAFMHSDYGFGGLCFPLLSMSFCRMIPQSIRLVCNQALFWWCY